ncbi:guanylate kinase [Candidatus Solincola sp.]|nr:guanylate kinase [Actinomycetota bacterium]MDI7251452.1 guanylate kinase [Actinomycetota bacterium]
MRRGRLFVVAGPSGAGKGTLIAELLKRYPRARLSVSATTRDPRPGEREGVDYHFLDREEFLRRAGEGEFLEWAEVHGNLYGTPRGAVEEWLNEGHDVILEIDVQGARQVRERMPEAVTVFVEPPSLEALEERLRRRGTESEEELRRRLRNAVRESGEKGGFRHVVVNDDLQRAVEELCAIYEKESASTEA